MKAVLDGFEQARLLHEADFHVAEASTECSLWWSQTPELSNYRVGCIGNLSASPGCPIEAVLRRACDHLQRQGCSLAIGPMDGSTWKSYRLVTQPSPIAPFLFEVTNPPEWKQQFLHAGFHEIAAYCSAMVPDLSSACREITSREARLEQAGIHIRPFDRDRFDSELYAIYRIAAEAFAGNFLYSPIAWPEFASLYYPLREIVNPDFVLLAEAHGRPVGFIFAMPDLLQAGRDAQVDTVIIKSLGVLPAYKGFGLGSVLVERVHQSATKQGYRSAIHALMHDDNQQARKISNHAAQVFRRYGLFARHLPGPS